MAARELLLSIEDAFRGVRVSGNPSEHYFFHQDGTIWQMVCDGDLTSDLKFVTVVDVSSGKVLVVNAGERVFERVTVKANNGQSYAYRRYDDAYLKPS